MSKEKRFVHWKRIGIGFGGAVLAGSLLGAVSHGEKRQEPQYIELDDLKKHPIDYLQKEVTIRGFVDPINDEVDKSKVIDIRSPIDVYAGVITRKVLYGCISQNEHPEDIKATIPLPHDCILWKDTRPVNVFTFRRHSNPLYIDIAHKGRSEIVGSVIFNDRKTSYDPRYVFQVKEMTYIKNP
jgi:hypothetical protein